MDQIQDSWVKLRCKDGHCTGLHCLNLNNKCKATWTCPKCKNVNPLEDKSLLYKSYIADFEEGIKALEGGSLNEAERKLSVFIDKTLSIAKGPIKQVAMAQEALRSIWARSGNLVIVD